MEKALSHEGNGACLSSFNEDLQALRSCNALCIGKILGQGSRSYVYELPQLQHHVIQSKEPTTSSLDLKANRFITVDNPISELNIGQPVLKSSDEQFSILRKQVGVTYAIPFASFFEQYGIDALLGYNQPMAENDIAPYRKAYASHLGKIARMPQGAYDQLVKRIQLIQQKGLYLDPCSLNILLDEANSSFNTLDHFEAIGPYENVLGLACALLDTMFVYLDEHAVSPQKTAFSATAANDPKLIFLRQHILIKLLTAALKSGFPLPEEACPKNYFGFHQSSFDMNYVLKISGISLNFEALQNFWIRQSSVLFAYSAA